MQTPTSDPLVQQGLEPVLLRHRANKQPVSFIKRSKPVRLN
ncbi:hypothetical protein [Sphingorhabdus sp.]